MTYDPNQRLAEPGEDDTRAERIEVSFAIPVWLTHEHQCMLHRLVNSICDYGPNVPADGVHWPSGYGSKPKWSRADARFLRKEVGVLDDDAPESGEPTFDDAVLFLETIARGFVSDGERERIAKQKPTADEPDSMTSRTDLTAKQFMDLARAIWDEAFGAGFNKAWRGVHGHITPLPQELWEQSHSRVTVENLLAVEATPGGEG